MSNPNKINYLADYDRMKIARIADSIINIPAKIDKLSQRLTANRAEKRVKETALKAREVHLASLLATNERYQTAKNAADRKQILEEKKLADEVYQKLVKRLMQLATIIDKSTAEKEVLDHRRKAEKAFLEAYAADVQREQKREVFLTDFALGKGVKA